MPLTHCKDCVFFHDTGNRLLKFTKPRAFSVYRYGFETLENALDRARRRGAAGSPATDGLDEPTVEEYGGSFKCRRYPPSLVWGGDEFQQACPSVRPSDGCGEGASA